MPRKPRMYLAGVPSHVVQRGNNREACFFADEDYLFYLECLKDACLRYGVALHAYVLMTNHVHLLLTPSCKTGISKLMQSIGRRYVQYVNKAYRRSGTLWEGRHKSSLVDAERYLLSCYRYIELNPVRANMIAHPAQYRWSSYRHNAQGEPLEIISEHDCYRALGKDKSQRCHQYQALFHNHLDDKLLHDIRTASQFSMPLGNERFHEQIERTLKRKIGQAYLGKPKKKKHSQLSPTP